MTEPAFIAAARADLTDDRISHRTRGIAARAIAEWDACNHDPECRVKRSILAFTAMSLAFAKASDLLGVGQ